MKFEIKHGLTIVIGIAILLLVIPVFDAIVLALLGSMILLPIRKRLDKKYDKVISTGIIVGIILIFLAVFLAYSSYLTIRFAETFYSESITLEETLVQQLSEHQLENLAPMISNVVAEISNIELRFSQGMAKSVGIIFLKFTVWIYLLFFLIWEQEKFQKGVSEFIDYFTPNNIVKDVKSMYVVLSEMYRAFFVRYILAAIIVGILSYIGFTITGTPFAIMLSLLCVVGALLPGLATYAIYLPIAIWQIFIGNIWQGAFLAVYGVAFLTVLPMFYLVPILTSKTSKIHPALVLLSIISGILLFGMMGFVYGPFLAGIVQASYTYYLKKRD